MAKLVPPLRPYLSDVTPIGEAVRIAASRSLVYKHYWSQGCGCTLGELVAAAGVRLRWPSDLAHPITAVANQLLLDAQLGYVVRLSSLIDFPSQPQRRPEVVDGFIAALTPRFPTLGDLRRWLSARGWGGDPWVDYRGPARVGSHASAGMKSDVNTPVVESIGALPRGGED